MVAPLKTVQAENAFDVFVNVKGGGTTGQAGAALLGLARALKTYDENYLHALREGGHLTRDPRMVERRSPARGVLDGGSSSPNVNERFFSFASPQPPRAIFAAVFC